MAPRTQADARSRIIEAADRLFYTQGYSSTGINQIIEEAGVAKASLYAHFPSKEALAVAYLERRHRAWFDELRGVVERSATSRRKRRDRRRTRLPRTETRRSVTGNVWASSTPGAARKPIS